MGPYRTRPLEQHAEVAPLVSPDEGVLPWLLILLGGGRVGQAIWTAEAWGAEATLCLGVFVLGVFELLRSLRDGNGMTDFSARHEGASRDPRARSPRRSSNEELER